MSDKPTNIVGTTGRLTVLTVAAIAILTGVHHLTRERIAEQQRLLELRTLQQVLPASRYDNDPIEDRIEVATAQLGNLKPKTVYRARLSGQPAALALQATAPDGYNGDIELLIGVTYDGTVLGVRVTSHRETPGLGDKIDLRISDWIRGFDGKQLTDDNRSQWSVRKRGGEFDQFTGATITPQAVVVAVRDALQYVEQQRDTLFER